MDDALLRGDCARCAGLCCVALAFDRSDLFGFDKLAGEPCLHLGEDHRCEIHGERGRRGFAGCARYDCLGAGQRVTQETFGGKSWRQHPELLRAMLEAFRLMRQVHEWLLLLREARRLPLDARQTQWRADLLELLQPDGGWSLERLAAVDRGPLAEQVRDFLLSLRACLPPSSSTGKLSRNAGNPPAPRRSRVVPPPP